MPRQRISPRALAAVSAFLSLANVQNFGFVAVSPTGRPERAMTSMCASKGFESKKESTAMRRPEAEKGKKAKGKTSSDIVKDKRAGKSSALTNTKLKDLRDKTLARRQQREAELDEYEEGRAMIAKYGPKVAVMPDEVAQRVAKRGMVVGGTFYGAMLAVFGFGIFLFNTQEIIIPPPLMAFITLILLALAVTGSSYGMMSASWDEGRTGSLLGFEEFGSNVKTIGEGFRRLSVQDTYEEEIKKRQDRRKLLAAKDEKKKELLNK